MSGAEAIAIIGLIDACIGITKTIIDIGRAVHDAQGLPPKLQSLFEQLPVIDDLLETAQERCENGAVTQDNSKSAEPILKQCEQALGELRDLFKKACPKDGDNRGKRIWKGAKTVFLGRDSQLQKLLQTIQDNLKLLEQKEIYTIGDKLDELQQVTEALALDDGGKYAHSGTGNIVANEGGNPTNYVQGGSNNRQINTETYYEGGVHNTYLPPERPETPPVPSSNVPFRGDVDFVERETLTDQLRTKLSAPAGRAALVGLGGAGKSQLAINYAHALRQQEPNTWVLWIHAGGVARFEQSVRDLADQVKLHGRQDASADHLQLLRNWLCDASKGKWLIVLDNADDADFLLEAPHGAKTAQPMRRRIDYIPACSHGSMMVTTRSKREALKLLHENETIDVQPMDVTKAVALLEKKLAKLKDPGSQAEMCQLVTALDRIPLAISQAAAYILQRAPRCSVRQYCEQLEQSRSSRTSLLCRDFPHPGRGPEASNSVLLTLQISMQFVYDTRRSAADLLSLMSCYDRLAIPETLLRKNVEESEPSKERADFEDDISMLRSFSFVSATTSRQTWEMHRLVQDATQMWLEDHRRLDKFLNQSVHRLNRSFPDGSFETWPICRELFPHVKHARDQKPVDGEAQLVWAGLLHSAAWYAYEQGSFLDTIAMAKSSLEVRLSELGEEDGLTLWSMASIAQGQRGRGQWKEAEQLQVKVLEIRRRVLGEEHEDTLKAMNSLALTYYDQGRLKEARELHVKVKDTRIRVLGAESPDTLNSMHNLALTYYKQGRWKEAEELDVEVIDTRRRVLGPEHRDTLMSMHNLALTYFKQERWMEAEELDVEVVDARRRVLGLEHPDTLDSMYNLAIIYYEQGRWKEAEELYVKVVDTSRRVLGPEHQDTLASIHGLANTYYKQERWQEAEELDVKMVDARRRMLGAEHPDTLQYMYNLALTYGHQGRWAEATTLQTQAVDVCMTSYGPDNPHTVEAKSRLAGLQKFVERRS